MDIKVLRNFLVVVQEGSITRAAELVQMTQSTLSRQMIGLEQELGVQLLSRRKHRVALTDSGMIFRRRAQEIVTLAEKAQEEMQRTQEVVTGEIPVGCNELQSMSELSEIIHVFRKKFPLITFDIRSGNNSDVLDWLDRGIVDIGLLGEPVNVERLSRLRMEQQDEWGILLSVNHPLAGRERVTAESLAGIPMITIRDDVIHSELTSWSGAYANRMVPIMHYNLLSNAAALIQDDESIAVCAKPAFSYPGLRFLPLDPPLRLGALLAWKGQQIFSKATQAFLNHLKLHYGS